MALHAELHRLLCVRRQTTINESGSGCGWACRTCVDRAQRPKYSLHSMHNFFSPRSTEEPAESVRLNIHVSMSNCHAQNLKQAAGQHQHLASRQVQNTESGCEAPTQPLRRQRVARRCLLWHAWALLLGTPTGRSVASTSGA